MNSIQPPIDRIKLPTPYRVPWFVGTEIFYTGSHDSTSSGDESTSSGGESTSSGDGGGGGGGGGGGALGDNDPLYDSDNPSAPPTMDCAGDLTYVESSYMWALNAGQNPNDFLSLEQRECHVALHTIEVGLIVDSLEAGGSTVTVGDRKWVYSGIAGSYLSMLRKSTCDPTDGIDDIYVNFGQTVTIMTVLCVIPPP